VVNITAQTLVQPVPAAPYESYNGLITAACFVCCFCGCLLGLIALIFAVIASTYATEGRAAEAKKMARVSAWLTITGAIVGVVLITVFLALLITNKI